MEHDMKSLIVGIAILMTLPFGLDAQQSQREFKLQAQATEFWKLIGKGSRLERVATGFGFTEGPVWDPHGFLYVSDETLNRIFRVYPDGHRETLIELGDPDGNTFDREFHLIDCASVLRGIIRINPEGHYTVLADHYEGKRFNSPNDVVSVPTVRFISPTLLSIFPRGSRRKFHFRAFIGWTPTARFNSSRMTSLSHTGWRFHRTAGGSISTTANVKTFACMISCRAVAWLTADCLAGKRAVRMMGSRMV